MREALFYERTGGKEGPLRTLCPQCLRHRRGKRGFCQVRINRDGTALLGDLQPRHGHRRSIRWRRSPSTTFIPARLIYSIGHPRLQPALRLLPELAHAPAVRQGLRDHRPAGGARRPSMPAPSASPTPTTSPSSGTSSSWNARNWPGPAGFTNVLVTNGLYNPEPFSRLAPLIDAMNIDIKSMEDDLLQARSASRSWPPSWRPAAPPGQPASTSRSPT